MNEKDLIEKGFRQQPDGSWTKRTVPVGSVEVAERKPDSAQTLDGRDEIRESRKKCVVVSIIGHRRRILDSDNFSAGAKALRDAISASLGIDDGDPRITWEYSQVHTHGPEGTIVLIST